MLQNRMAQPCGEAHRGDGGKILGRYSTDQADNAQRDHDQAHFKNIVLIAAADTRIHDAGHHQRDEQLEGCFQQLEQRAKDTFLFIALQIFQ